MTEPPGQTDRLEPSEDARPDASADLDLGELESQIDQAVAAAEAAAASIHTEIDGSDSDDADGSTGTAGGEDAPESDDNRRLHQESVDALLDELLAEVEPTPEEAAARAQRSGAGASAPAQDPTGVENPGDGSDEPSVPIDQLDDTLARAIESAEGSLKRLPQDDPAAGGSFTGGGEGAPSFDPAAAGDASTTDHDPADGRQSGEPIFRLALPPKPDWPAAGGPGAPLLGALRHAAWIGPPLLRALADAGVEVLHRILSLLERLWITRIVPVADPALASVVHAIDAPLRTQPPMVRSVVGFIAAWTAFMGLCVGMYLAFFRSTPDRPVPDDAATLVDGDTPEPE